jgi:hypothetical protein
MDFNQNTPLVFHWKNKELDKVLRLALFFSGLLIGLIPIIIWLSFPSEFLSQIDWPAVWQKLLDKPLQLTQVALAIVAAPISIWAQSQHNKNARLMLDDKSLQYSSGLPLLSRWFDWQLDLEGVRSGKRKLNLNGRKYGKQPLALYRFSWGVSGLRQFRPAAWVLPNQTALPLKEPTSFMGYVSWKNPENAALLEEQFSQLPLIKALTQRGIDIPKIAATTEATGLDLMAHPRMKVAVISFFVTLVGAFVLFHLMRHQHYFSAPPISYQLIAGTFAGLLMFAWLWGEKPNAGNTAEQAGFRGTQVLLACLFAVSAGLCAPSVPLLFASMLQTSQEQSFELQKSPLLLKSSLPTSMPAIQPTQALEYWQSLKDGEVINLPISRGFAGLWWQYDSSVLQDKVEAFYSSQPMSTINKRR